MTRRLLALWLVFALTWFPVGGALHQALAHASTSVCAAGPQLQSVDCKPTSCGDCLVYAALANGMSSSQGVLLLVQATFAAPRAGAQITHPVAVVAAQPRGPPSFPV